MDGELTIRYLSKGASGALSTREMAELFTQDQMGQTALHHAAQRGDLDAAWGILRSLAGTGVFPPRKSLLEIRDLNGMTAADVADMAGHVELAETLKHEWVRMELFE